MKNVLFFLTLLSSTIAFAQQQPQIKIGRSASTRTVEDPQPTPHDMLAYVWGGSHRQLLNSVIHVIDGKTTMRLKQVDLLWSDGDGLLHLYLNNRLLAAFVASDGHVSKADGVYIVTLKSNNNAIELQIDGDQFVFMSFKQFTADKSCECKTSLETYIEWYEGVTLD